MIRLYRLFLSELRSKFHDESRQLLCLSEGRVNVVVVKVDIVLRDYRIV